MISFFEFFCIQINLLIYKSHPARALIGKDNLKQNRTKKTKNFLQLKELSLNTSSTFTLSPN